jgi:hypothetical protein
MAAGEIPYRIATRMTENRSESAIGYRTFLTVIYTGLRKCHSHACGRMIARFAQKANFTVTLFSHNAENINVCTISCVAKVQPSS